MASIVKLRDKRSGAIYVYESESYWDKEKQQPRSKRKLIGRLDEETGEVVPTDGRGRKRKDQNKTEETAGRDEVLNEKKALLDTIERQEADIKELKLRISALQEEKRQLLEELKRVMDAHR